MKLSDLKEFDLDPMKDDLTRAMDDKRMVDPAFDEGDLLLEITGREYPTCP